MMYWICDLEGNRLAAVDSQPVTIGRTSRVTIRVDDETVSRVHCHVYRMGDEVIVSDLGSRNGTFLDGVEVTTDRPWPPGGVLTLSSSDVAFTLLEQADEDPRGGRGQDPNSAEVNNAGREAGDANAGHAEAGDREAEYAGAADREDVGSGAAGAARPVVGIAACVLIVWLLISQAVLLGEILAALQGLVRPFGTAASSASAASASPRTLAEEIEALRRALGSDDVPEAEAFELLLAEHVRAYADSPEFALALERGSEYLPLIRNVFEEHNVPAVFAVLPIVESHFNPRAWNRRTNARGMWQFRPATAREYGLVIATNRDDRLDPSASTHAAAEYLRDLLAVFGPGSISLVAAAYNAGDSRVRFALRQIEDPGRERVFWHLSERNLLPRETRRYVIKVLAAHILAARWDRANEGLR